MKYLIISFLVFTIVSSCQNTCRKFTHLSGKAQGTYYNIKYCNIHSIDYHNEIEQLLKTFDSTFSTYLEESIISRVNNNDPDVKSNEHFNKVFEKAKQISEITGGLFDITVGPLVNAYGFGIGNKLTINEHVIDSLLNFVGYEKVIITDNVVKKENKAIQLDMNALAQGYAVDLVCKFLDEKGIKHYMVELGGEVRTKGKNQDGVYWRIGIDKPIEGNIFPGNELQDIISLKDKALATSGNYRKFYEEDGIKYTHSINPKTGRPARSNLLSATILANDCITADAYATACMVSGLEKSKELVSQISEIEAYLIYADEQGEYQIWTSTGIVEIIE
ncbi:FAD:protein FMN transferase [Bacteroidota bacterium]